MKRLQGRWVVGIVFVFLVAVSMWFAAPTITAATAGTTQPAGVSATNGVFPVYVERGIILIEKRDKATGQIINEPGFTVMITPNPYTGPYITSPTPPPGNYLSVRDNVMNPSGNFDLDQRNGYIKLQNVLPGTYSIVEVRAPAGYLVDPTIYHITVNPGSSVTFVSRDNPISGIPASSNTTLWIMVAIFGASICGFIVWRSRHNQISSP